MKQRRSWFHRALALCALVFVACASTVPVSSSAARVEQEFLVFLDEADAAQLQLQQGDPAAYLAIWSHADDVTLSGGFGGTIEKGWPAIEERLRWVAQQYSEGRVQRERVSTNVSGNLGYVVQLEHIQFRVPGQATESRRDYRVTMIFRREAAGWRMVHRQADAAMVKEAPR